MLQKVWMVDISLESFINAQKRSLMAVNFNSNIHQQKLCMVMSSRTLFFHCRLHAKFFRSRHFPSGMQSMCWWFFFLCYVYFWPSPKTLSPSLASWTSWIPSALSGNFDDTVNRNLTDCNTFEIGKDNFYFISCDFQSGYTEVFSN